LCWQTDSEIAFINKLETTSGFQHDFCLPYTKGHQRGACGHQVARKGHVGRPRAFSKNNISMINVFTLTNINIKLIEGK